jgi:4-amino-4-deoxy-L-arabinose transferase-like glycosyltransferase
VQLLRIVSLLAGTASVPLTYLVGLRTVGRRAAAVAATLVALSPFLIFYSPEARAYALMMFLVLASTLALLKALERQRVAWWALYAGLSCAAIYTHYTALFVLAAQFVWAFFRYPGARRALLGANLAAALGFLPWLPALIKNTRSVGTTVFAILEPFNLHAVGHDLGHWSIAHPYIALTSVPGTFAIVMIVAGILAACFGIVIRRRHHPKLTSAAVLPILLAVAAPFGLAVYSSFANSVWDVRNLISSWPGLALVVGGVLTAVGRPLYFASVGLPYALLPATPAGVLARQAELGDRDGKLFVIAPGSVPVSALLHGAHIDPRAALGPVFGSGTSGRLFATISPPVSAFVRAISPRFRPIETRTFPGFLPLSLYVFQRR